VSNITEIPDSELRNDLAETEMDIKVCEVALLHGIAEYNGKSTEERLIANKEIKAVIEQELKRRNNA
jgi:hypothetical protein